VPTKHVAAKNMDVGKIGSGKHWTVAEVQARQQAEESLTRKTKVRLKAPEWLSKEALQVWKRILKQTKGLQLLDNLDENMLAIYCDTMVKYQQLSGPRLDENGKPEVLSAEGIKALQAYARLLAGYADKLGLTPAGRARLAKREADKKLDEFGEEFDE
jgi:P27 family predicted phage terminase small subunit